MRKKTIEQFEQEYEQAKKNLIIACLCNVSEMAGLNAVRAVATRRNEGYSDTDDELSIDVSFFDEENNETSYATSEPGSDEVDGLVPLMHILDTDVCIYPTEYDLTTQQVVS